MKKLIIGITLVFVTTGIFAQNANDYKEVTRDVIKTEKKAAIAEAMQLTDQESTVFWPLYNEYNEKMYVENSKLINTIKDYANNYDKMTDEKAEELWTEAMKIDSDLLKLKKSYFKKFVKIMPATKAVRYFQAENKIKSLVDAKLALEIPLFEEMK
jgi:vacuolar-type H+-ATPase catalytic subunit A/Vma1